MSEVIKGQLLRPPLLICPTVRDDGTFRLRTNPEYRHEHFLATHLEPTKPQITEKIDNHRTKGDFYPGFLQEWFQKETTRIAGVLEKAHNELQSLDPYDTREKEYREPWTRKLILELFPQIKKIIDSKREHEIFQDRTIEEFIDERAMPLAQGFVEWVRDFMPEKYRPSLYYLQEITSSKYLIDLVRLYQGGTVIIAPIKNEPKGTIFNDELNDEVINMLSLVYLATISEISKYPHEEKILKAFNDAVSSAFPERGKVFICGTLSKDRYTVEQLHISEIDIPLGSAKKKGRKKLVWKRAYEFAQEQPTRRINPLGNDYVIFLEREKEEYSRMLKLLRGHFPLSDALGARFILSDKNSLEYFITKLTNEMADWTIIQEKGETVSPESQWQEGIKYRVKWNKRHPDFEFEMALYWLKEGIISTGNWAQNLFGYKENFYNYRIRQLLKDVLPFIHPTEFCQIDWESEDVQKKFFDYAQKRALESALLDFY